LIGKPFDFSSFGTTFSTAKKYFSPTVKLAGKVPKIGAYVGGLDRVLFLGVRSEIICVDDLERAGVGLRAKDVLGLISFLKEERRCKIVLLLNEEQLAANERDDFLSLLEKVVDIKLEFRPTAKEAADIAIDQRTQIGSLLWVYCISL